MFAFRSNNAALEPITAFARFGESAAGIFYRLVSQPDISRLLKGQFRDISVERLMRMRPSSAVTSRLSSASVANIRN